MSITSSPHGIQNDFNILKIRSIEDDLFKIMRHLQYIMKFVIRSRILYSKLNGNKDKKTFEASLDTLFESFTTLMSSPNNMLRPQGAILKYLHLITNDLIKSEVYDPTRLANKIVNLLTNIPPGKFNQWKMICIKDLVNSELFKNPECRAILLPVFCQQIKDKLESKEEVSLFYSLIISFLCVLNFSICYLLDFFTNFY